MHFPSISLTNIVGGVYKGPPAHRLTPPFSPNELNLRIRDGRFSRRPGTRTFGADAWRNDADNADITTAAGTITGMVIYLREDGGQDVLAFTGGAAIANRRIYRYDSGVPRWANITAAALYDAAGGDDLVNTATDMWDFAVAPNATRTDVLYASYGALTGSTSELIRYHPALSITATGVNLGTPGGPCRYLASFGGRLVLGYVYDTAGGAARGNRIAWSNYLNAEGWTAGDAGAVDLTDTPDQITRLLVLRNRLIVYKERSIFIVRETGELGVPFGYEIADRSIGTLAPYSVGSAAGRHFFLGPDNIYSFNSVSPPQPIGNPIRQSLKDINPQALNQVFSIIDEETSEYILFVPEGSDTTPKAAWVFNYNEETWTRWEFPFGLTTGGRAVRSTAEVWSGAYAQNTKWSEAGDATWASVATTSGVTYITGNADKTAEEITPLVSNDGTSAILSFWDSRDVDFIGESDRHGHTITTTGRKILARVGVRCGRGAATTLTCDISKDAGATFSTTTPTSATISGSGDVVYFDTWQTGTMFRVRLKNQNLGQAFPEIQEVVLYYLPTEPH